MIRKTKILVNHYIRESYGDESAEGAAAISQVDDEFGGADNEF